MLAGAYSSEAQTEATGLVLEANPGGSIRHREPAELQKDAARRKWRLSSWMTVPTHSKAVRRPNDQVGIAAMVATGFDSTVGPTSVLSRALPIQSPRWGL